MAQATIGIIGGSGLYQMDGMEGIEEVDVATPFGAPSDTITIGTLAGTPIAFLPRHGRGHRISPTEVPARANIFALKTLGVEWIISVSAVGSLREEIAPLDLVIPDQIIDRTKSRVNSFFGHGIVAHVGFADPFCPVLSELLHQTASETRSRVHRGGTLMAMEGPLFSTRAESNLYRSWGASIIGMTALPEAKLAREAEICYATLACTTDYDCWHETEEDVTIELIIGNLLKNVATSKSIIRRIVDRIPQQRTGCLCPSALSNAIVTSRALIPEQLKRDLAPLVGKYL
ncbi:MAG: S-methyl-5'-thioadenosine phosphorylase [Dehalococcoidia bacterium]|nr:S-methyl-5'-thioadenosine phosphorylase [Dehalococcoidia bacterium]